MDGQIAAPAGPDAPSGVTKSRIRSYWRPNVSVPAVFERTPIHACRPNRSTPFCDNAPVVPEKPFSSVKTAASPPPRSSRPRSPQRAAFSAPLVIATLPLPGEPAPCVRWLFA